MNVFKLVPVGLGVVGVLWATTGSSLRHPNVVGTWQGRASLAPDVRQEPLTNVADGLAASVSLDLRADHTFHLIALLVPIDGTWTQSGASVTLIPERVLGYQGAGANFKSSPDGPIQVVVASDGTLGPVDLGEGTRFWFARRQG